MTRSLKAEDVLRKIDDAYEADRRDKPRRYIGASIVGNQCQASIAFNLRGFPNKEPDAKLKRIFGLGHKIEDMVVADLKKAGYAVWEVDALTGKQYTYSDFGGHVVCHTDGMIEIEDELMILEIKSMNDASFTKFVNLGVKQSHPQYFGQVQMMMGMARMQSSLFIAYNKNTSAYHCEVVEFDQFEFGFIRQKVGLALSGEVIKIAKDETDWRCRFCFKSDACWGHVEVPALCQTCTHSSPTEDGGWYCNMKGRPIPDYPCDDWQQFKPAEREV